MTNFCRALKWRRTPGYWKTSLQVWALESKLGTIEGYELVHISVLSLKEAAQKAMTNYRYTSRGGSLVIERSRVRIPLDTLLFSSLILYNFTHYRVS